MTPVPESKNRSPVAKPQASNPSLARISTPRHSIQRDQVESKAPPRTTLAVYLAPKDKTVAKTINETPPQSLHTAPSSPTENLMKGFDSFNSDPKSPDKQAKQKFSDYRRSSLNLGGAIPLEAAIKAVARSAADKKESGESLGFLDKLALFYTRHKPTVDHLDRAHVDEGINFLRGKSISLFSKEHRNFILEGDASKEGVSLNAGMVLSRSHSHTTFVGVRASQPGGANLIVGLGKTF